MSNKQPPSIIVSDSNDIELKIMKNITRENKLETFMINKKPPNVS